MYLLDLFLSTSACTTTTTTEPSLPENNNNNNAGCGDLSYGGRSELVVVSDRDQYRLVALTALYLSMKVYSPKALCPNSVAYLSKGSYTRTEVERMELTMLQTLQWKIHPPIVIDFVRLYFEIIVWKLNKQQQQQQQQPEIMDDQHYQNNIIVDDLDLEQYQHAIMDLVTVQTDILHVSKFEFVIRYCSSHVAVALLLNALQMILIDNTQLYDAMHTTIVHDILPNVISIDALRSSSDDGNNDNSSNNEAATESTYTDWNQSYENYLEQLQRQLYQFLDEEINTSSSSSSVDIDILKNNSKFDNDDDGGDNNNKQTIELQKQQHKSLPLCTSISSLSFSMNSINDENDDEKLYDYRDMLTDDDSTDSDSDDLFVHVVNNKDHSPAPQPVVYETNDNNNDEDEDGRNNNTVPSIDMNDDDETGIHQCISVELSELASLRPLRRNDKNNSI